MPLWHHANRKWRRIIWPLFGFWLLRTCVSNQSWGWFSWIYSNPSGSKVHLSILWVRAQLLLSHLSKCWNLDDNAGHCKGAFHGITLPHHNYGRERKHDMILKISSLFSLLELFISLAETKGNIVATIHIIPFHPEKSDTESGFHVVNSYIIFSLQSSWIYYFPFVWRNTRSKLCIPLKDRMNIWEHFWGEDFVKLHVNMPSIKLNLSICFLQGIFTCPLFREKFNEKNTILPPLENL